jgi:uncharacterized protein YajQ (UPF0234 family)
MIKKAITTLILLLPFVNGLLATDIKGHWTGRFDEQYDIAFDFKVYGEVLNGSTVDAEGQIHHLYYGVFKDDKLSFTIDMMGDPIKVTGKIKDDVITLIFKMPDHPVTVELIRAN